MKLTVEADQIVSSNRERRLNKGETVEYDVDSAALVCKKVTAVGGAPLNPSLVSNYQKEIEYRRGAIGLCGYCGKPHNSLECPKASYSRKGILTVWAPNLGKGLLDNKTNHRRGRVLTQERASPGGWQTL